MARCRLLSSTRAKFVAFPSQSQETAAPMAARSVAPSLGRLGGSVARSPGRTKAAAAARQLAA